MKNLIYLWLFVFLLSCTTEKEAPVQNPLIGSWKNLTLNISMSIDGKDSALVANEGEWEKVLGIKPIITTFNKDSTFKSDYYTLDNQLFHTTAGMWWMRNDSLVMLNEDGEQSYGFKFDDNQIEFKTNLDWNQDGIKDSYQGTQIRVE